MLAYNLKLCELMTVDVQDLRIVTVTNVYKGLAMPSWWGTGRR